MTDKKQMELIDSVLDHVHHDRRAFLRHLLTAAGAAIAVPLMTTRALGQWPDDECYYWERKVKKGKFPGEYSIQVKKKKCPPDEFWFKGKKGKRFEEFAKKAKKGEHWFPDDFPP